MNKKTNLLIYLALILFIFTIILSLYGFIIDDAIGFGDAIYQTIQLFKLGAPIPEKSIFINIARFLAPLVLILGGVQLLVFGLKEFCLWTFKEHTIILGYSQVGREIKKKLGNKKNYKVIIVDPSLEKTKYSFNQISLKEEANEEFLTYMSSVFKRAQNVIIATDNDYINLKLGMIIRNQHQELLMYIRIEQLQNFEFKDEKIKICQSNYSIDLENTKDSLLIILGGGIIGKEILNKNVNKNKVVLLEQSKNIINKLKDEYDEERVCYKRTDVTMVTENDIKQILSYYPANIPVYIYMCLGGDWLGFKTAYEWSKWKIWENNNAKIYLCNDNINQKLLDNCNISKKIVILKNIETKIQINV